MYDAIQGALIDRRNRLARRRPYRRSTAPRPAAPGERRDSSTSLLALVFVVIQQGIRHRGAFGREIAVGREGQEDVLQAPAGGRSRLQALMLLSLQESGA